MCFILLFQVEHNFNYLEIQGITCNKPTQLTVDYERGVVSLKLTSTEEVNEVVAHIGICLQRICPGLSPLKLMKKLSMEPPERITSLQTLWDNHKVAEPGPCGGFSQMYRCVCDWLGLPYREEVQWDVDTIYLTQDTRDLSLQDFSHLENRDLVAIIAVLEYNQWFTKLSTKDCKLSADVSDQILRVVARSSRLEELVLDNAGLTRDFAQKLANALSHNPNSGLHTVNLANNPLEDRGITSLGAQFAKLPKGLKHLNFSKTSLSPKGVNSLAQSLSANQSIPSTLSHLDLSGNILRADDIPHFYHFLGQPNSLTTLDLSNTDCSLDLVCSALLRGSVQNLSVLNMSKSVFAHRKGKDVPPSFKHFFSSAVALSCINLSGTKLPPEALKALLLGLASNPNIKEVSLDLSCCEVRTQRGLDSDLSTLLVWLAKNRSIRHLSLGKNFNNIKSKNLAPVLDNLVHMIQEEESPLTSLSLADSKLKTDLTIVLNALGSNTSLTRVDISGNAMGDMGAKMLAKALQINSKLRTVIWDKNNISPQGLQDVAAALEKNFTIRFMPIPIIDASQALKASPEKTEDALLKIENYLFRNHETRQYLQEQAYRLQQGIVTTTTQQMIDRICVKVQDHLNSLRNSETDVVLDDVKTAENLMKDARNSKTLLPNLYHLGAASREEVNGQSVGPIQEKLESMAGEVARVMDEQLQGLLESMVDAAEGLCPHVMRKTNLRQDLIKASTAKMVVPRSFVKNTLLEQSGVDIINKISEVKLSLASFLSDRIVDEILEALSGSQHTLVSLNHAWRYSAITTHGNHDNTTNTRGNHGDTSINSNSDYSNSKSDHSNSNSEHSNSNSDHSNSNSEHSNRNSDHSNSISDHSNSNSDHSNSNSEHSNGNSEHSNGKSDYSNIVNIVIVTIVTVIVNIVTVIVNIVIVTIVTVIVTIVTVIVNIVTVIVTIVTVIVTIVTVIVNIVIVTIVTVIVTIVTVVVNIVTVIVTIVTVLVTIVTVIVTIVTVIVNIVTVIVTIVTVIVTIVTVIVNIVTVIVTIVTVIVTIVMVIVNIVIVTIVTVIVTIVTVIVTIVTVIVNIVIVTIVTVIVTIVKVV
uniref:CARMIL C-terminal domain-containing protein n=1 Tax=Oncorhynchus tshawytscha TaxID=74940 RepID=A0AAZ3RZI8_ONCTS